MWNIGLWTDWWNRKVFFRRKITCICQHIAPQYLHYRRYLLNHSVFLSELEFDTNYDNCMDFLDLFLWTPLLVRCWMAHYASLIKFEALLGPYHVSRINNFWDDANVNPIWRNSQKAHIWRPFWMVYCSHSKIHICTANRWNACNHLWQVNIWICIWDMRFRAIANAVTLPQLVFQGHLALSIRQTGHNWFLHAVPPTNK